MPAAAADLCNDMANTPATGAMDTQTNHKKKAVAQRLPCQQNLEDFTTVPVKNP